MSLRIFTWDPTTKDSAQLVDGDWSFGLERYRVELWSTDAVRGVGAQFIPRLASGDLYVRHDDLDALEMEARRIEAAAEAIAAQLFIPSAPGPGAVVVQTAGSSRMHDAWGGGSPAESVKRYISNLLRAIDFARHADCGLVIW